MNLEAKEIVQAVPIEEAPANPNAAALVEENTVMQGRVKCTHPGCLRHFKKLKGMQNHLATHANLRNILCRYNCGAGFNVYGPRNLHEKLYCKLRPEPAENAPAKGEKRKALEDGPEAKKQRVESPAAAPSPSCASPALPTPSCASPYPSASARFGSFSPLALPQAAQQSQISSSPVQLQGQFYSPAQQCQYYSPPQQYQYYSTPQQYQYYSTPQQQQYYSSPEQQQYYSSPKQQQSQHYSSPQQYQYSSTSQQQQTFVSAYHPQSNFYQPQSYGQSASSGSAQFPEPPGLSYATLQPIVSVSKPQPSDPCASPPSTCNYSLNDGSVAQQQPQFAAAQAEPSLEKILTDVLASDSRDGSNDSWLYKPNGL